MNKMPPDVDGDDMQLGTVDPLTHVPDDPAIAKTTSRVGVIGSDDPAIGSTEGMTGVTGGQAGTSR